MAVDAALAAINATNTTVAAKTLADLASVFASFVMHGDPFQVLVLGVLLIAAGGLAESAARTVKTVLTIIGAVMILLALARILGVVA